MRRISEPSGSGLRSIALSLFLRLGLVALGLCLVTTMLAAAQERIILHLKNGDRIAGTIVSEDTNRVVLTTPWIKELPVPLSEIESREHPKKEETPGVAATHSSAITNRTTSVAAGAPIAAATLPSPQKPKKKSWKAEIHVGADFLRGATEQQTYYGRMKLTYEHPYDSNPKDVLKNVTDLSLNYGRTEGIESANSFDASDKVDIDIGRKKMYAYVLTGSGYDDIRKIDFRYEIGPGAGYHLFTQTNFLANVEAGIDYQKEQRTESPSTSDMLCRFAEDVTWKFKKQLTLTEKFELFPQLTLTEGRARFESTLSYAIWQNVSLNLTVLDLYDTKPAVGVPKSDLQIHSAVGITF